MKNITLFAVSLAASMPFMTHAADFEDVATVRNVVPLVERVNTPRQVCNSEYVSDGQPGERGVGGAVIGGVAGAILGNQVGKGNGKTATTAIGAAVGAMTGDRMQNNSGPSEREVRRCHMEDRWTERTSGYSVTYQYHKREFTTVMPHDPGVGIGGPLPVQISVMPRAYASPNESSYRY